MAALRAEPGKDIWLFGGGSLFRSFLEARLVDTVEVGVMPVLLGGGIPLLPPPAKETKLKLTSHRSYATTGIVGLEYAVQYARLATACSRRRRGGAPLLRRLQALALAAEASAARHRHEQLRHPAHPGGL